MQIMQHPLSNGYESSLALFCGETSDEKRAVEHHCEDILCREILCMVEFYGFLNLVILFFN